MKTLLLWMTCITLHCHAQFMAGASQAKIDQKEIKLVVEGLGDIMANGYMDEVKGNEVKEVLQNNLKLRKYKKITTASELVDQLMSDVQSVIDDKHFNIIFFPNDDAGFNWTNSGETESPEEKSRQENENFEKHRLINFGLPKVEVMEGNVGYLKVSWFNSPNDWFRQPLADAFSFLKNTDCLIIDVRSNPGGLEESVSQLASFFFEQSEKILLCTSHMKLSSQHVSFYTDPAPGVKYLNKRVYLLTNSNTGSGGEMIAYHMKHFKKATLVGERTSGAANGFNTVKIGSNQIGSFMVLVPDSFIEHAVTGTNWERIGVEPDIKTSSDNALLIAYKDALANLEAGANDAQKKIYQRLLKSADFRFGARPKIKFNPGDFVGRYGIRTISTDGEILYFQRDNSSKVTMNMIGEDQFELDIAFNPKPIVTFVREDGKVVGLQMKGPTGEVQAKRTEN